MELSDLLIASDIALDHAGEVVEGVVQVGGVALARVGEARLWKTRTHPGSILSLRDCDQAYGMYIARLFLPGGDEDHHVL